MKNLKLLAPLVLVSGLLLGGAAPAAIATAPVPTSAVESVDITADSGAVLAADTVEVGTVAAEPVAEPVVVPVVTAEPVPTAEPSTATVEPVAPVVEPSTAPAVPAAEPTAYPAPTPEPSDTVTTCNEDMDCWKCAEMGNGICGNPACKEQNLFTVDTAGTCGKIPAGFTEEQVRADALLTFNSGHDPSTMPTAMREWFDLHYVYSGVLPVEGHHFIYSKTIPGAVYSFDA